MHRCSLPSCESIQRCLTAECWPSGMRKDRSVRCISNSKQVWSQHKCFTCQNTCVFYSTKIYHGCQCNHPSKRYRKKQYCFKDILVQHNRFNTILKLIICRLLLADRYIKQLCQKCKNVVVQICINKINVQITEAASSREFSQLQFQDIRLNCLQKSAVVGTIRERKIVFIKNQVFLAYILIFCLKLILQNLLFVSKNELLDNFKCLVTAACAIQASVGYSA